MQMLRCLPIVIVCAVLTVTGCAGHPRSDQVEGEVVKVEMIQNEDRSAVLPLVAGTLAGAAVDAVQGMVAAEGAKLERQFGAGSYRSDFWTVTPRLDKDKIPEGTTYDKDGDFAITNTYSGFRILRFTKNFPESGGVPAMMFEASLKPSHNGRLFLIQPVKFITREARAKVVNADGTINSTIGVAVDAMWIDKNQLMRQERIATASFDVMNYDLDGKDGQPVLLQTDYFGPEARVGWFPGVPVSVVAGSDKPLWQTPKIWKADDGTVDKNKTFLDGAFKITVFVTERDASEAKEYIERAAKFIGEQREKVVDKAKGVLE